jgi:hypothetical protein
VAKKDSRPSEARDRVLAKLPAEKQVEILQRAEKRGPSPDDPDWLLIETMMTCAARMEAASGQPEIVAQLERIESRLNRYAESRGIFETATETDRTDIRARLDRIETQMEASLAKMPSLTDICGQLERIETRMEAPPAKIPSPIMVISPRMRDLMLFTSAVLLCVAVAAAFGGAAAPFVVVIAAFAVGLCTTIAYCWLIPMFSSEK